MAKDVSLIRIKADTNDYERSIKQAQKTWDDFTKGLGVNVGKLTGVAAAIGAVTGALKVAKDAFFKNEEQLDEWGRTVKSAESLYSGFLNALNTGNISGYLQNMNNIVNAARAAYDAMDALGTFNAFNQINLAKAQTNLTNAIADFREGTGSKDAVRSAADALKNELQQRQKYEQEAYDAAVANLAAQRGVSASDLMKAMSGSYGNYQTLKNVMPTGSKTVFQSNGQFGGTTSYNVAVPANEAERLGEALRQLNDTEIQSLQALGAAAQRTANEIANTDKQVARVLRGNTGGSGSTGGNGTTTKETYVPAIGSIDEMRAKVKALQDEFNKTADQSIRGNLLIAIDEAQKHLNFMQGKGLTPIQSTGSLTSKLGVGVDTAKELNKIEGAEVEDDNKEKDATIQAIKENMNNVRDITSSVSGILNGIQNMGIEIPEEISRAFGILQTMSSVLTAILTITTLIKGEQEIQTGASIFKAIFPFAAGGGIIQAAGGVTVPGNNFSGDLVPAFLNSGELILNKAQQGVLAATLQDSSAGNRQTLLAKVKGTDLIVMLDRTGRMTGKGELAFWKD